MQSEVQDVAEKGMNMDKAAGDLKSSANETVYDRRL